MSKRHVNPLWLALAIYFAHLGSIASSTLWAIVLWGVAGAYVTVFTHSINKAIDHRKDRP